MKVRGFEVVSKYNEVISHGPGISGHGIIKCNGGRNEDFRMPFRASSGAAGYDIVNNTGSEIVINPGETIKITTYIKAYMQADEVLTLFPRSSHGFKYLVRLANTCGIIDADYYNNIDNEGEIFLKLTNPERSGKQLVIPHGEAMCQGIFSKVLQTDDDYLTRGPVRVGGIGSTTRSTL
jgi:dUTP pyrophosphatase